MISPIAGSLDPDAAAADCLALDVSVVMPCLNEEGTLANCIAKARQTLEALGLRGEVLVADNGSEDRSVEIARQAGARVVVQPLRGYGNALRAGFDAARGRWIVMGDCDESYDFGEIGRLIEPLQAGADLVMGNRLSGEIKPGAMPWLHRWVGNPLLSRFLNLLFQTGVGDSHCGLRAFTKAAYDKMHLQMPGMELASEMVIKSALARLRIVEVPIVLWPDGRNRRSHLRSFRDGWRHLRFMLMCSPLFLFVIPGLVLTLVGLSTIPLVMLSGYGVFTDHFGPNFLFGASICALTGWHLLIFGLLAKLYAAQVDSLFEDRRTRRFAQWFTVERGMICGGVLTVAALAVGVPVIVVWLQTQTVPRPGQWILAGTLLMLGIETIFASFLIGILEPRRRD